MTTMHARRILRDTERPTGAPSLKRGANMARMETARDEFLEHKRNGTETKRPCSPTTLRTYRQHLQSFIDWMTVHLGNKAATGRLTGALLKDYLAHREGRDLSRNTVANDCVVLREFVAWGVECRYWRAEDTGGLPRRDKPHTLPRPYDADERDRMMALPLRGPDRVLRAALYFAGLRLSEVIGLRLRDLTPPHVLPTGETIPGRLYVRGKGARERVVDMHAVLWREMEEYLRTLPKETKTDRRLLVMSDGEPWSPATVQRRVRAWGKAAGVAKAKTHRWRHTFATDVLDGSPGELLTVQALLGHSSVATTQIYAKVSNERKAAAVGRLPDFAPTPETLRHDLTPACPAAAEGAELPPENAGNP